MSESASPRQTLSLPYAVAMVVGMVVGVGIFKTPSVVAAAAQNDGMILLLWLMGGFASVIGALCYAELMSAYPDTGGDYHFLSRAFGAAPAFLYAWARLMVIQTGAIAMMAFIIGDYASEIYRLGPLSSSIYAVLSLIILTAVNVAGIRQGKWTQIILVFAAVIGLVLLSVSALSSGREKEMFVREDLVPARGALATAMIYVLLTYGGWNEASFLSAEIQSSRRHLLKVLLYSIGMITFIYLLVNFACLKSLGRSAMAASGAVLADMAEKILGPAGGMSMSLLILLTAASTANAAILTGARTAYALGKDVPILQFLGHWQRARQTPVNALLIQGGIALALVVLGTGAHDGFMAMVAYSAPVFWLFFLMVGSSIFILRRKDAKASRPFRVPFYPVTPLVFCGVCAFMFYAALAHTGKEAIWGVWIVLSGIPLFIIHKKWSRPRANP